MGSAGAAAARALVGTRFRLHGRDAHGLDCVGVAARALAAEGYAGPVPTGYALRGGNAALAMLDRAMAEGALARCDGAAPGDVLLFAAGLGQWHLAVRVEGGIVHADAALRRVVERPGADPWPLAGAWRVPAEQATSGETD